MCLSTRLESACPTWEVLYEENVPVHYWSYSACPLWEVELQCLSTAEIDVAGPVSSPRLPS